MTRRFSSRSSQRRAIDRCQRASPRRLRPLLTLALAESEHRFGLIFVGTAPESLGTLNPDLYRDFPDLFRAVP